MNGPPLAPNSLARPANETRKPNGLKPCRITDMSTPPTTSVKSDANGARQNRRLCGCSSNTNTRTALGRAEVPSTTKGGNTSSGTALALGASAPSEATVVALIDVDNEVVDGGSVGVMLGDGGAMVVDDKTVLLVVELVLAVAVEVPAGRLRASDCEVLRERSDLLARLLATRSTPGRTGSAASMASRINSGVMRAVPPSA